MSKIRCQIICKREAELPVDHITNTIYFDDFEVIPADPDEVDWMGTATDVRDLFNARGYLPADYGHEVKVYDMADAEPRPVKAHALWVEGVIASGAAGPREVALCLSFYGQRNLPRQRGRIYIGPFTQAILDERPSLPVMQQVGAFAAGIGNIGGVDVDWQIWSPRTQLFHKVTNWWVDNEWDTVRSRGLRAMSRIAGATDE